MITELTGFEIRNFKSESSAKGWLQQKELFG